MIDIFTQAATQVVQMIPTVLVGPVQAIGTYTVIRGISGLMDMFPKYLQFLDDRIDLSKRLEFKSNQLISVTASFKQKIDRQFTKYDTLEDCLKAEKENHLAITKVYQQRIDTLNLQVDQLDREKYSLTNEYNNRIKALSQSYEIRLDKLKNPEKVIKTIRTPCPVCGEVSAQTFHKDNKVWKSTEIICDKHGIVKSNVECSTEPIMLEEILANSDQEDLYDEFEDSMYEV